MINEDSGDTYEEYLDWVKAAEVASNSQHEELRRSYKPGQRWQTRIPAFTDWFELPGEPGWFSYAEYRQILDKPLEAMQETSDDPEYTLSIKVMTLQEFRDLPYFEGY